MHSGDPYILAAMDGVELDVQKAGADAEKAGPVAYFYVIFGLVCEALGASSTDSASATSARESTMVAALQTLKFLVRPEYSGKAMMESATFEEFSTICYRMAMTESAGIQTHLVEMLMAFATNQGRPGANSDVL